MACVLNIFREGYMNFYEIRYSFSYIFICYLFEPEEK